LPIRLGPLELGIILLIVILLFGAGRIGKVAGEIGRGMREFRKGLKDDETPPAAETNEINKK
jgi:sec-independent protein translocase protein TatA